MDCALNNPGADQAAIWAERWPGVERRTDLRPASLYARSYNNTSRHPNDDRRG